MGTLSAPFNVGGSEHKRVGGAEHEHVGGAEQIAGAEHVGGAGDWRSARGGGGPGAAPAAARRSTALMDMPGFAMTLSGLQP